MNLSSGGGQTKREKFYAARRALNRADTMFETIGGEVGVEGRARVKAAIDRLNDASEDKGS
jgi:hypothetical protein